jgi:hypothetical protein
MQKIKPTIFLGIFAVSLSSVSSLTIAADTIKSYTSTLYDLDDTDANNKRIRLLYAVQNAWNLDHIPDSIKEVKLVLSGGSGFDMTNVPQRTTLYEYGTSADYRYSIPTSFQLKVNYHDGANIRHWDHKPSNTISSASVSETSEFSLGITSGQIPVISGGASWSTNVRYDQAEFTTIADYNQNQNAITWNIQNQSIRHKTPPKNNLIYAWTNLGKCNFNNLIPTNELPVVMRSDFRPEASVLYRKDSVTDGQNNTRLGLRAAWTKTHYHFARDWCTFYSNFSWKNHSDYSQTSAAERVVSIGWSDSLYH